MALHPEIAKVLATLPARPVDLDPVAMRAAEEAQVAPDAERLPLHSVQDATLAGVPVRVYAAAETTVGTLVYFHGGAFFLGSLETHDHVARSLAKDTGHEVISVGYRLAPENAFPAGLDDCYAVVRAVAAESPTTLAIAGDSSGGTYVAAVTALAHDDGLSGITHQILFYPSLDLDFDGALASGRYASLRENAVGYGLETAGLTPFNAFYIDSGADAADPRVSPINRGDLSGLPPALVITGELDPLRDEAELYGRLLQEAGVRAVVSRYDGAGHGFVQHFSWLPEYHRALEETTAFLRGEL